MDGTTVVAYATFITAGLTFAYITAVTSEIRKGKRIAAKFRGALDEKILTLFENTKEVTKTIRSLCRKGGDEVEKDLIDPVTKPIIETKHKYDTLKTGERKIRRVGMSKISPHLQKLLQKNRQFDKNRYKKFRKKLKQLQQEVKNREKNKAAQQNKKDVPETDDSPAEKV